MKGGWTLPRGRQGMQGALGGTHPAPAGGAGRRPALPCGSSGSKGVESSWMAAEQEGYERGDRRPTPSHHHPPPREPRGSSQGCLYWGRGPRWQEQGRVSPAAGIVGALSATADGAKGPLGAADGCSARIPAGQMGPARGQGEVSKGTLWDRSRDGILGDGAETGTKCSCRIGGTEKGQGEEEFKGWGFPQDKEPGGVGG